MAVAWEKLRALVSRLPESPEGLMLLVHGTIIHDYNRTLAGYFVGDGATLVIVEPLRQETVSKVCAAAVAWGSL